MLKGLPVAASKTQARIDSVPPSIETRRGRGKVGRGRRRRRKKKKGREDIIDERRGGEEEVMRRGN